MTKVGERLFAISVAASKTTEVDVTFPGTVVGLSEGTEINEGVLISVHHNASIAVSVDTEEEAHSAGNKFAMITYRVDAGYKNHQVAVSEVLSEQLDNHAYVKGLVEENRILKNHVMNGG